MKDYYKIFGIDSHATISEIQERFQLLVAEASKLDESKRPDFFKNIHEAFEVLSSSEKREFYDKEYIVLEKKNSSINNVKRLVILIISALIFICPSIISGLSLHVLLISFASSFLTFYFWIIWLFDFVDFDARFESRGMWYYQSIFAISASLVLSFELFWILFSSIEAESKIISIFLLNVIIATILKAVLLDLETVKEIKAISFHRFKANLLDFIIPFCVALISISLLVIGFYQAIWATLNADIITYLSFWLFSFIVIYHPICYNIEKK